MSAGTPACSLGKRMRIVSRLVAFSCTDWGFFRVSVDTDVFRFSNQYPFFKALCRLLVFSRSASQSGILAFYGLPETRGEGLQSGTARYIYAGKARPGGGSIRALPPGGIQNFRFSSPTMKK